MAVVAGGKLDIIDIKTNAVLKSVDTGVLRFTTNEGKIYTRNRSTASVASIDSLGSKTVLLTYRHNGIWRPNFITLDLRFIQLLMTRIWTGLIA